MNDVFTKAPRWFKGLSPAEQYGIYRDLWLKNLKEYAVFYPEIKVLANIAENESLIIAAQLLRKAYFKISQDIEAETLTDLIHKENHYKIFHPPKLDEYIKDFEAVINTLNEIEIEGDDDE